MTDKNTNLNAEAQFDVLPVLGRDRIYSFGKYTYVIVGFAMATWCFMIGGSLSAFVGFKTAIIASVSGNLYSGAYHDSCNGSPGSQIRDR